MTTLSAAIRRSDTFSAGKASRDQNQRSPERVALPSSANISSSGRTSAPPRGSRSMKGSSKSPACRWPASTSRLSGSTRPSSGLLPRKYSGWRTMNWSSGELEATNTATAPDLRPARPSCCQVEAMVPG